MAWKFERIAGPVKGGLGGICWAEDSLFVSAVEEGVIFRFDTASGSLAVYRKYTNRTNGIGVDGKGNLYGCQEGSRRVIQFCPDGSAATTAVMIDGQIHNHPNNMSIDRLGRIWFSDPHSEIPAIGPPLFPPLKHASVLRLERDLRREWLIKRMTYDTTAPRAVLLSTDEKTLYVAEGGVRDAVSELRAYSILNNDYLGGYHVLQTFGSDSRGPHRGIEGMCLDSEGNIVACAGYNSSGPGAVVMVISPNGVVLESHLTGFDLPVNCIFGNGSSRGVLYVTTQEGNLLQVTKSGREGFNRFSQDER